jgi:threonine dehydratase
VIGVEAAAAPSAHTALAQGGVVTVQPVDTLADGIATKRIGKLTYPLLSKYVDDVVLVSEDEIASAILVLLERARTVVEGAGAVGLAALMAGRIEGVRANDRVVVVVSGGNIDVTRIDRIIRHGLAVDGRLARLAVRGPDRPGLLARIAATVARLGGNIMEVDHERDSSEIAVGSVGIEVVVESEGRDHAERIAAVLAAEGLQVTPLQAHPGRTKR